MCQEGMPLNYGNNVNRTFCLFLRDIHVLAICTDGTHGDPDGDKTVVADSPTDAVVKLVDERSPLLTCHKNFLRIMGIDY
ncbi:MAG: hypothetical protein MUF85_01585 [Patescibacteria group bacterium]|jgi:hypothetical protein|nr:hypothetical protein [Patescibacteria group bacterium]